LFVDRDLIRQPFVRGSWPDPPAVRSWIVTWSAGR